MRRLSRKDLNQNEIVSALQKAGCTVFDLSAVGSGMPDIIAGRAGVNYLLEIKCGSKLTDDQVDFHKTWEGQKAVVNNIDEALQAVGLRLDYEYDLIRDTAF